MVGLPGETGEDGIVGAVVILKQGLGQVKKILLEPSSGELPSQIGKLAYAALGILLHFPDSPVYGSLYHKSRNFFRFQWYHFLIVFSAE